MFPHMCLLTLKSTHPVLYTSDHAHLKEYYNSNHLCFCQVCSRVRFFISLLIATLSYMIVQLTTNKVITHLFYSLVLNLIPCVGFGLRVSLFGLIIFGSRFSSTTRVFEDSSLAFSTLPLFMFYSLI